MEDTTVRHLIFGLPVWKYKINDWQNKKQHLLDLFSQEKLQLTNNVLTTRHNIDDECLFEEIHNFLGEYYEERGISFDYFGIDNMWFQLYETAHDHSPHHHGAIGFSCVAFIDYDPKEHNPTTFISKYDCPLTGDLLHWYPPNVEEGDIIFFPSNAIHYCPSNNSNKKRLILSMNIRPFNEQL